MQKDPQESGYIIFKGAMELAIKNAKDNELMEYRHRKNTVVTAGRRWVLERIQSSSTPTETFNNMAIGRSTAGLGTDDTALSSEFDRKTIGTMTTTNLTSNPPSWAKRSASAR